jgi:hypothetical protein
MELTQIDLTIEICTHEKCNTFLVPDGLVKQCLNCKKVIKIINS